ncbi:hypothetical protein GM418_27750 [Maribellus comscasis]|uniref:PpiC domain-containing protein n=1 Tax=Maribellus comscasis TaxID=2681766 RepID=A0A6I6KAV0_9BACT|nr:peptidylprolyl isomerase [Maribellus comscasis]QGY47324.1 hypothetical protein GM418_27750 [Maribellus comscasis]
MVKTLSSLFILCFSFIVVWGQKNETLLTIDTTKISLDEFERIYKKNNSNLYSDNDKKSPKEYLELFINFKLKVIEAQNLKMDTSSAFINELSTYRKELAEPYLTDINFEQELDRKMYDRMLQEVNASHILFMLDKNASPEKEKEVLQKALKVRQEILDGKDFNEASVEYSEDPSAKTNKGNLGYFSAFTMVAPFEDAAYTTPVGQVSEPVRSSFGYHLIKVHEKRKNRGEIKVAHIMKMFPRSGLTESVKKHLKSEIDSIYNLLESGGNFSELAKKLSDDKRSGQQGGEMPWFSAGRMLPAFSNPAFAIQNIGDYTKPVETPYGFHIIKKMDEKPVASFEELQPEIEARIKKDPLRSTSSKKAFVEKLKKEYGYQENFGPVRSLKTGTKPENTSMVLFTIDDREFTFELLDDYLAEKNIKNSTYGDYMEEWTEYEITKLENSKLEEKYPEFRYLMKEYHDGILLFNISEKKIWNFAAKDTAGLEKYYSDNQKKYSWEERFKGYIILCNDKFTREEADKYFAAGMTDEEISDLINAEEKRITITKGAWEKGNNPVVDYYVWNGAEPQDFNTETTFIRGDKIPPEPKNMDEARGLYISDYQDYLEEEWIKSLKKKYKIKVNKKLLKKIQGV